MAALRNKRPDLNGALVVDKPLGMSSARVCAVVRRRTAGAKVGHAGTLDPLATGVLVLCLGTATRSIESLMAGEKEYLATVDLSAFSTTDDLEGDATPVEVMSPPAREAVEVAIRAFIGETQQRPPVFSAVHVGGERAYRTARKAAGAGRPAPERPPARTVRIDAIEILSYEWPRLELRVRCGKGVYIRSLARDLGEALGTGGRLLALRRTRVGPFTIADATALDAIAEPFDVGLLRPLPDPVRESSSASV